MVFGHSFIGCCAAIAISQLLSTRFGDGEDGGRIDARALLVALGHEEQTGGTANGLTSACVPDRGVDERWAARGPHQKKELPAATAAAATATGSPERGSSESKEKGQGFELSPGENRRAGLDLDVDAAVEGPTIETPPPAYEDVLMQCDGTPDERASATELNAQQRAIDSGETNDGVSEHADQSASAKGRDDDRGEDTVATDSAATAAEQENARLRSELAVFDLGFFEEVEDLKYSYATLKREAEKLAKKQGVDLAASLGLPEDGEEPWDRTVDMAHHSVDWAETARRRPPGSPSSPPRGARAARLARQWDKLSSGLDGDGERDEDADTGLPLGSPPRRIDGGASPGVRTRFDFSARRSGKEERKEASAPRPWNGLIAAHERKLAWEISTGGMGSLACLRESIGRVGRSGNGFGCDEEVFSALRQSGYALELDDVAVLRTGLGSSADCRVDLEELMILCEDIASGEEWYVPAAPAVGAAPVAALPPAVAMMMRAPEKWNVAASRMDGLLPPSLLFPEAAGAGGGGGRTDGGGGEALEWFDSPAPHRRDAVGGGFGVSAWGFPPSTASASPGLPGAGPLYLGGTVYGDRSYLEPSKNAAEVLEEVKDQLKLLDADRFFRLPKPTANGRGGARTQGARDAGPGAVTLGQAVGVKFSRRDPSQSGLLSAREVGLALEDVGVSLRQDEVVILCRNFKPPGGNKQQIGGGSVSKGSGLPIADDGRLDGVVAEYAPLVRLVVDCLAEARGIDPSVGGRARLGQRGMKWNERMPAPAKRLRVALSAGAEGGGWLERLRQRLAY